MTRVYNFHKFLVWLISDVGRAKNIFLIIASLYEYILSWVRLQAHIQNATNT